MIGSRISGMGRSSYTNNALPAGANTVILAAGSNVNGLILRRWMMQANSGSVSLIAKAGAAPTGIWDGAIIQALSGSYLENVQYDLIIPSGLGLHVYSTTLNCGISVGYDLL